MQTLYNIYPNDLHKHKVLDYEDYSSLIAFSRLINNSIDYMIIKKEDYEY